MLCVIASVPAMWPFCSSLRQLERDKETWPQLRPRTVPGMGMTRAEGKN